MPKKYHIETKPVPPRRPRTGKYGIVDWREDCARCHNCVKKACVYDRHREEQAYIRNLNDVDALFFDCMGCFSCVQECTKNLLRLSVNPAYENLGNRYWTPEIIQTTWLQAETAKIPVSGAGYGGRFSGHGFDGMWTDMSEIVRPTRDGIHGREYISTAVDIGTKPSYLSLEGGTIRTDLPQLMTIPMPLIIDMVPEQYRQPSLEAVIAATAVRTDLVAVIDSRKWPVAGIDAQQHLDNLAFYFAASSPLLGREVLGKTRLVEIEGAGDVTKRMAEIRAINPGIVIAVRVPLDAGGIGRAVALADEGAGVIHVVADDNGDEIGAEKPALHKGDGPRAAYRVDQKRPQGRGDHHRRRRDRAAGAHGQVRNLRRGPRLDRAAAAHRAGVSSLPYLRGGTALPGQDRRDHDGIRRGADDEPDQRLA